MPMTAIDFVWRIQTNEELISLYTLPRSLSLVSLALYAVSVSMAAAVTSFILFIINLAGARFIHRYLCISNRCVSRAHSRVQPFMCPYSHIAMAQPKIWSKKLRAEVVPVVQNINSPLKPQKNHEREEQSLGMHVAFVTGTSSSASPAWVDDDDDNGIGSYCGYLKHIGTWCLFFRIEIFRFIHSLSIEILSL